MIKTSIKILLTKFLFHAIGIQITYFATLEVDAVPVSLPLHFDSEHPLRVMPVAEDLLC